MILEQVARAISLEMKRQWSGQEIVKELNDPTSWSAEGGELNLTDVAKAAIQSLIDADWPHNVVLSYYYNSTARNPVPHEKVVECTKAMLQQILNEE